MADKSKIEWTAATWNPTVGCTIVSPGCTNCYAMKVAHGLERRFDSPKYRGLTKVVNGSAVWTGEVRLDEAALLQPLKWNRGRRIFVNSMSDLFHESLSDEAIDRVFAVMALCPQHAFQVLTKRAERMREYFTRPHSAPNISLWQSGVCWAVDDLVLSRTDQSRRARDQVLRGPLPNVWLGVSAERQQEAEERIGHLIRTPAAVRFISAEPLLGPVDLTVPNIDLGIGRVGFPDLDWVIVGGESGSHARPMNPQWARDLRDQCQAAGIAFFHKQNGEYASVSEVEGPGKHFTFPDGRTVRRVGKKAAGRLLDGIEHNEFPAG